MTDKSHVSMECCAICHEETGTILLDTKLRQKFEMHTINPASVCQECKDKYLSKGVLLINPKTGSLVVISDEGFKRMTDMPIPQKKIVFAEEEMIQQLIKLMEAST